MSWNHIQTNTKFVEWMFDAVRKMSDRAFTHSSSVIWYSHSLVMLLLFLFLFSAVVLWRAQQTRPRCPGSVPVCSWWLPHYSIAPKLPKRKENWILEETKFFFGWYLSPKIIFRFKRYMIQKGSGSCMYICRKLNLPTKLQILHNFAVFGLI